jgi:tetratricopeptide (TPR) repeat protein
MSFNSVLRCSLGLALCGTLLAQGVKPPAGGGAPNPGRPTNPTQPNINPNATTQPDFSQHPLYLSGKVLMEDGTAPPDTAMIQLVCRSTPRTIGRADTKGGFSIDLNNRAVINTMADASETGGAVFGGPGAPGSQPSSLPIQTNMSPTGTRAPGNQGDRDLMGCDLQAALPGFRSDVLHLDNRHSLDDTNVGTLILHRLANVDGTTISATTALAPKDARKAVEKGFNAIKKDKWDEAVKEFQKAVDVYPKYATAWVELGKVQERQNNLDAARQSYAKALEADNKLVTPYLALASLAAREQKWQEVNEQTELVLRLNPVDFPQAYLLNSMSNYYLKNLDAAEKSAREGLHHDAEHRYPKMNQVLGVVLANKRDYTGAAEQLRQYLHYAPDSADADFARRQLADIEKKLDPEAKKQ